MPIKILKQIRTHDFVKIKQPNVNIFFFFFENQTLNKLEERKRY